MPKTKSILSNIPTRLLDTTCWPMPFDGSLNKSNKDLFERRCGAVKAYIGGAKLLDIEKEFGIDKANIGRLVKRCLETEDGSETILGFTALLPFRTNKSYSRKKSTDLPVLSKSGLSGAFKRLLESYPVIKELILFYALKKQKRGYLHQSRISIEDLHSKFLDKCRQLGLENDLKYPFNTSNLAYVSLSKYVKKLLAELANESDRVAGKQALAKKSTGTGNARPDFAPFERVECDAHKIDAMFCVLVPSPFGDILPMIVKRIWLITAQDVCTRAVLGYHLVLSEEVNRFDVLRCIQHACKTWVPIDQRYLNYPGRSGFPSTLGKRYVGLKWGEFSVDSALANLATSVESKLTTLMGIRPKVLPRKNKDDRPFVERLFKTLEERSFHKLPNTTGSNKDDPLRNSPEVQACKYFIQIEEIHGFMDVVIADYNGTPHNGIGKRTPLEYLKYRFSQYAEEREKVDSKLVDTLHYESKTVTVKGNQKQGVRPYINFMYSKYSSSVLRNSYSFCGKNIHIEFDPDDLRFVSAYFEDGAPLGKLVASPPWHLWPHSLKLRKAINSQVIKKNIILTSDSNPVEAFLDYHERTSKKQKIASNAYLEARKALVSSYEETSGFHKIDKQQKGQDSISKKKSQENNESANSNQLPTPRKAKFG